MAVGGCPSDRPVPSGPLQSLQFSLQHIRRLPCRPPASAEGAGTSGQWLPASVSCTELEVGCSGSSRAAGRGELDRYQGDAVGPGLSVEMDINLTKLHQGLSPIRNLMYIIQVMQ